eukprot:jgi/Picre1/28553/NNA_003955.t1
MHSLLVFATLVLLLGVGAQEYPVLNLAVPGTSFEDLPYADWLTSGSNTIELSIEVATLVAKDQNGSVIMRVNAPVYRNEATGDIGPFGPMLTLKRGENFEIRLTNNLMKQPGGSNATQKHIGDTNFHVHGLHESPGTIDMATASQYSGGDNVFISLKGREDESKPGNSLTLYGTLPEDHLPGNHWYHAHAHLSTSIQTFAAHGGITIEDDDAWLPDSQGCNEVRNVLNKAEQKIMLFTCYPFFMDPANSETLDTAWNVANYQLVAEQGNASYCCDEGNRNSTMALYGTGIMDDLVFLNGGFQPLITMKSGVWQRWSMALASYKSSLLMQIVDQKTQNATDACEIMLISKDGVFVMEIPRTVSYMHLSSGGRAQVLVRCNAPEGTSFDVITSRNNTPAGNGISGNGNIAVQKLMSVTIEDGSQDSGLQARSCTPLRPAYAADLRDSALAQYNVTAVLDPIPDFTGTPPGLGCSMSGEKFSTDQKPYMLEIGTVVEWKFSRLAGHPLHTHTNPFQIQKIDSAVLRANTTLDGGWFEPGDFYDTFLIPMLGFNATNPLSIPLRLQPGKYAGYTVAHCHFLQHEDSGCMHMMQYICPQRADLLQEFPYTCSQPMSVPGTFTRYKGSEAPEPTPGSMPAAVETSSSHCISIFVAVLLTITSSCIVG